MDTTTKSAVMFTLKLKLIAILTILSLMILGSGGLGYLAHRAGDDGLETVYADRVVPMRDLKAISDAFAVAVVDGAHKMRSGAMSYSDGVKAIDEALIQADRLFADYMKTRMDDRERGLAAQVKTAIDQARPKILDLRQIAAKADGQALVGFAEKDLYPAIDPITAAVDKLVGLQMTEAKNSYERAGATNDTLMMVLSVFMAVSVALVLAGFYIVLRQVTRPIGQITAAMSSLAGGALEVLIPHAGQKDEIGEMAAAVAVFKENAIARVRLEAEQKQEQEERQRRAETVEGLIGSFERVTTSIVKTVAAASTELQASAQTLTATAEETASQAIAVSAASEQASSNVQTVAASSEEMNASIGEIGRQVTEASQISAAAVAEARSTQSIVLQLSQGAQRIGEIVSLIGNVAGQTNLLALNATIEAARAGEAGRGFAVVASEVKGLADQTAKASAQIASQIMDIQSSTEQAVSAIGSITGTIDKISAISAAIAGAVEEQNVTTREISRSVTQASLGTSEVASNISGVTRAAEETSSAASQVLGSSKELSEQAETLRREVEQFLSGVRAA